MNTDQPEQVHGALLRWNLESTLLAAYDEREALQHLAGGVALDAMGPEAFFTRCKPDPRTVEDDAFIDTFEDSQRCLAQLVESMRWRKLEKGDTRKVTAPTRSLRLDRAGPRPTARPGRAPHPRLILQPRP